MVLPQSGQKVDPSDICLPQWRHCTSTPLMSQIDGYDFRNALVINKGTQTPWMAMPSRGLIIDDYYHSSLVLHHRETTRASLGHIRSVNPFQQ